MPFPWLSSLARQVLPGEPWKCCLQLPSYNCPMDLGLAHLNSALDFWHLHLHSQGRSLVCLMVQWAWDFWASRKRTTPAPFISVHCDYGAVKTSSVYHQITLSSRGVTECSMQSENLREETLKPQPPSSPQGHKNTPCSYHTAILSDAREFHKQT